MHGFCQGDGSAQPVDATVDIKRGDVVTASAPSLISLGYFHFLPKRFTVYTDVNILREHDMFPTFSQVWVFNLRGNPISKNKAGYPQNSQVK